MDLRLGDLVWSKMKGYSAWPSMIVEKPDKGRKNQHKVLFYGAGNHAWIPDDHITLHSDEILANAKASLKKPSASFLQAIQELEETLRTYERAITPPPPPTPPKLRGAEFSGSCQQPGDVGGHQRPQRKAAYSVKAQLTEKYRRMKEARKLAGLTRRRGALGLAKGPRMKFTKIKPRAVIMPNLYKKRIGFLGLGRMGRRLVTCLLKAGHPVTIWGPIPEDGIELVRAGAQMADSPAQVVSSCNLILSCVSDSNVARKMLFQDGGVLEGMAGTQDKSYVELSSLDPASSQEMSEAIKEKRGRYLEAPMQGNFEKAEEGSMCFYGAGDFELFHEIEDVFAVISEQAYFISDKVGFGATMALMQSSMVATLHASLAEAMALGDRCGVPRDNLLKAIRLIWDDPPILEDKTFESGSMCNVVKVPLRTQQRHIQNCIKIADEKYQPTPVRAATNELYKLAKGMGYGTRDSRAVYPAVKF